MTTTHAGFDEAAAAAAAELASGGPEELQQRFERVNAALQKYLDSVRDSPCIVGIPN